MYERGRRRSVLAVLVNPEELGLREVEHVAAAQPGRVAPFAVDGLSGDDRSCQND